MNASPLLAAVMLLGSAAVAHAAPPSIALTGSVDAVCTLPVVWTNVSQFGGAAASQFAGKTWTIPPDAFAGADATGVTGDEYAIRIRGVGFCNTSHTISLQSVRGGLAAGFTGSAPPNGFANKRAMRYEAQWSAEPVGSAGAGAFGPQVQLAPTVAGQTSYANYIVSAALAPPGHRAFDIRLGLQRGSLATPLVSGNYSDIITVTLAPNP